MLNSNTLIVKSESSFLSFKRAHKLQVMLERVYARVSIVRKMHQMSTKKCNLYSIVL